MPPRRVIHILRWFAIDGHQLRGEESLVGVAPALLRQMLGRAEDDLLLGTYPIGPEEEAVLAPYVTHVIDRDSYVYFLEPAQAAQDA